MVAYTSQVGQLYYGPSGVAVDTVYTNKATFLSENPGATLVDFAGLAPAAGSTPWVDAGNLTMTVSAGINGPFTLAVYDDDYWIAGQGYPSPGAAAPFASVGPDRALNANSKQSIHTINLVVPAGAVGFNLASLDQIFTVIGRTVQFYDGATLLHTETYTGAAPIPNVNVFTGFIGYARANAAPAAYNRITGDGDARITGDGDNRVIGN